MAPHLGQPAMTNRSFTSWDPLLLGLCSSITTLAVGLLLPWLGILDVVIGDVIPVVVLASLATGLLSIVMARFLLTRRIGVLGDAAESKTRTLEKARSLLQVIVDNTPASLLLVDEDRVVVEANRLAQDVHGTAPLGKTCHELLCQSASTCPTCPIDAVGNADRFCRGREEHTDPITGEVLSSEVIPLVFKDGKRYTLIVERIVTEQRKMEARMVHQEKMAAFGLLAAGIAHDMGNPLSSVEMNVGLLDLAALPDEERATVREVKTEVGRLRRILRELVDFARRRRDESSEVSIQSVVEDALRLCRHDPRMRSVEVECHFDSETPPVRMIEDHMVQVILNLVINAMDSMPEGGSLVIRLQHVDDRVGLEVRDTGVGMASEDHARCFEPLFTTKEPGKGTGLGLSICKDIIEAAGGSIDVLTELGGGTRVRLWLPAARVLEKSP